MAPLAAGAAASLRSRPTNVFLSAQTPSTRRKTLSRQKRALQISSKRRSSRFLDDSPPSVSLEDSLDPLIRHSTASRKFAQNSWKPSCWLLQNIHLHHRIQKNIRIRECIRWNHHWGHQTQTTTLCSRSNPHQRRGTFAKSSRNKLIREKPCFCPSFRMCRKGGVPKARILKRRPKLMLEVRWFFRVQILWHRDYWRVVPNPISLESGEKVFQVFPPYVRSHLPPPIMPPFHPPSLKNPPIPPCSQKNAQPNFCGAV